MLAAVGLEVIDTAVITDVVAPGDTPYEINRMSSTEAAPTFLRLGLWSEADAALVASFWDHPNATQT
jgi:hypothetical protein